MLWSWLLRQNSPENFFSVSEIEVLSYNSNFFPEGKKKKRNLMLIRTSQVSSLFLPFNSLPFFFLFSPLLFNATISTTNFYQIHKARRLYSAYEHISMKSFTKIIEGDFESVAAFWRIYGWNHWLIG